MAKYITRNAEGIQEMVNGATIGGSGDANAIPQLDAGGKLAAAMLPDGVGSDTVVLPATESLSAGDQVNFYNNTGTASCRKADGGTNKFAAHGYVKTSVSTGNPATIYKAGSCPVTFVEADIGKPVFLSVSTPGLATVTVSTGAGKILQSIGYVEKTSSFDVEYGEITILA